MTDDIRRRTRGPTNVLYLADQHDECDEAGCMDLLGADAPREVDVLFVSFTETARERLASWKRHADAPPANVGIVSVEGGGSSGESAFRDGGPTVRRISDPSDLTGVGIAVSEFLSAWADDGNRTVVCFDSLTALLQYLEPRQVFQFCNEITSKFETAGAAAHFHITPEAHDRQVLSVLSSLFDDRVAAADLGYRSGASDGADDGADVGPSGGAGAPGVPSGSETAEGPEIGESAGGDGAATGDPASPDDPSTADPSNEGGFVFAGDEFSPGVTAEPTGVDANDDFLRGGASGAGSSDEGSPGDDSGDGRDREGIADEVDDEPADGEAEEPTDAAVDPPTAGETTDASGRASTGPPPGGDDPERVASDATLPRTAATVVGVVAMLVLMSFLAAAFPTPMVLDGPDDGDGNGMGADTATPGDVAAGSDVDGTTAPATSPTKTATRTQTATRTSTSTPTPTTDSSSPSAPGASTVSDETTATPESTPTESATATDTPGSTPTPSESDDDGGLLSGDDDSLLGDDGGLL